VPVAERPSPAETRDASATRVDTGTEAAPEQVRPADVRTDPARLRPADTSDLRQQQRERTATTREATRDRAATTATRTTRVR
jgi:hypothetical protein